MTGTEEESLSQRENSPHSFQSVLFLDKVQSFQKNSIETLRQPLEERNELRSPDYIALTNFLRIFVLAAAMNRVNAADHPDQTRWRVRSRRYSQYLGRISKPLLDRIDICALKGSADEV